MKDELATIVMVALGAVVLLSTLIGLVTHAAIHTLRAPKKDKEDSQ